MLLPHRGLAVGMVLRATGNRAEAEDCVHDAMVRLVRREDLEPVRVRSLLVRASLHIAIDRRRTAAREQGAVVRLRGGAEGDVVSPEEVFDQRTEAARVLEALDLLPRRERQVMLLRLAGLNVAETAARLGISHKSVEGAFTRARARIRYLLGGLAGWVLERFRRTGSPGGGGMAAAATVAAFLLLGPGATPGGAEPSAAPPGPGRAVRAGALLDVDTAAGPSTPPPAPADHAGRAAGPASPPAHPRPGWQQHYPHPDAAVGGPVDAPYGLASWGVYGIPTSIGGVCVDTDPLIVTRHEALPPQHRCAPADP
jgi:RNA polymerase sigma factor (sigma-70 family)